MFKVERDMLEVEQGGSVLQFYSRLYGGLFRTKGYGEDWKSTYLKGRFPVGLYLGLWAISRRDPHAEPEWFIPIRSEDQEGGITLLLTKDVEGNRHRIRIHYLESPDRETTAFGILLELEEVDEWVKHINDTMTCWPAYCI